MKIKRMGITEILRRIWLFSANEIKSSESFSKQPTQLIIAAHNCLFYNIEVLKQFLSLASRWLNSDGLYLPVQNRPQICFFPF